jgi:O-antigen/teichoic acid export membrane protein
MLTIAQAVASGGNYALNLLLGRWLTPHEFADASLLVTLMLLASSLALGLQLVTARAVALERSKRASDVARSSGSAADLIARLTRYSFRGGAVLGAIFCVGAPIWREVLNTGSALPFVMLGVGMPWYLAAAVGRGSLQGALRFASLAMSYVVEMAVRVGLSVALVVAGFGVSGAAVGLALSFLATWVAVRFSVGRTPPVQGTTADPRLQAYAIQIGILLLGQIIANNGDVLIAKHYLSDAVAARYAAVALVGRAVFFLTWSVAITLFPVAARRRADAEAAKGPDRLLIGGALAVLGLGLACTGGAAVLGGPVLKVVLGPHYGGLSVPLAGYALATTFLAVANLVASHYQALGVTLQSWALLGGAVLQTVMLLFLHHSIAQLVIAQIIAMALLLAATLSIGYVRMPTWMRRVQTVPEVESR